MQAIILAAGMGKRLGRYTQGATKCMVKVNGKALIEYAIESLVANGVSRLVMVIGYKGSLLKEYINSKFNENNLNGMKIEYIENAVYDKTNNIYSLYLARNEMKKDDTLLLESDIIFKPELISKIIADKNPNLAMVSHFESWMDGTCTQLDSENNIVNIVDKKHFNWQNTDSYYKTVNIYKFSPAFSTQYYVPFLEAYQKSFGKNEYYEEVLKVLSFLSANMLKGFVVSGNDWYEIDDPADLAIAETRFASKEEQMSRLQKQYGGYWRFPQLKDFCYLVNPYFPPQKMVDELTANFKTLLTEYPSGAAQQSLLAGKIFNVLPEHIAVGNGAAELISSLCESVTGTVAIPYPTFNEYPERFKNAKIVPISVKEDFTYGKDEILKVVHETGAKTVLLINPDNPSGNFIPRDEVIALLDELKNLDVTLIFDESFIDFADSEKRYTLIDESIIEKYPSLIIIKSISKSYGVPGLRLGVFVNNNAETVKKICKTNAIWNINSFGEYFLQIYDKYKSTYKAACDSIAFERKRFISELSKFRELKVYPSQANFLLCKLECPLLTSKKLAEQLLESKQILIKDLSTKKVFEGKDFIRLAIRDKNENNLLIETLKEFIK